MFPLLLMLGFTVAFPGLQLLNQEWGWIPTQTGIYDIELNGHPISNESAIRFFVGTGPAFWFLALLCDVKSLAN